MKHRFFSILGMLVFPAALLFAQLPEQILGPGLNAGRTPYHQQTHRTLSADTAYILTGLYYVDSTYTLTIQPGTVVFGDTGAALIITRGAQIFAMGGAVSPIVFTSNKAPGARHSGNWGGVLILGKAPCNKVNPLIEGGIIGGSYGGNDPNDNSGIFRYVRIEFGGYRFQLNNEVNGLTMGGVGAGTEIHHIQVSYADDDSYEWFGGTVSAKHLVAFGGTDDEFDTDYGYSGKVQFAFGLRDPNQWDPTGESNGFESDNDGSATSTDQPWTAPVFSNITLIGPERMDALVGALPAGNKFQYSALLRRSTRLSIYNSAILGYPWGFRVRDVNTIAAANADTLQVRNVSLAASARPSGSSTVHDSSQWAGIAAWFNTPAYGNTGSSPRNPSAIGLADVSTLADPNPVPATGSELIGGASFSAPALSGLDVVTYRGAFEPGIPMASQWTAGWTNFDPQNTNYRSSDPPTSVEESSAPDGIPQAFTLKQNYPNPFNPTTTIGYSVAGVVAPSAAILSGVEGRASGLVRLAVYDLLGREMAVLVDEVKEPGSYEVQFNAAGLTSGFYFYRMTAGGFTTTYRMVLLK